jgi:peroxiredoxin
VLVIDVLETEEATRTYAERSGFTFPVLLDRDGAVSTRYAPAGVLPDLPRDQVPIASNLIIDPEGKIQFYTLLDSVNFDARLVQLKAELDRMLSQ